MDVDEHDDAVYTLQLRDGKTGGWGHLEIQDVVILSHGIDCLECNDQPWADSDGDDCQTYEERGWCFHPRQPDWLVEFAVDGVHAGDACCACGGGADAFE